MGAIASQLAETIPAEKIRMGVSMTGISEGCVELADGERLEYSELILATEAHVAAGLLGVSTSDF